MSDNDNKQDGFIPDEDYEYEQQREEAARQRELELERQERLEREERDRQIARDKVELMKLKTGVISESDTIKEEHTEYEKLHGTKWIANFWYHNKIWIIFGAFVAAFVIFIMYDLLTRVKPDITVLMIANNGLAMREEQLESFFEEYTEDLNGDGKVEVLVITMPLDPESTDELQTTYQSKFLANLQDSQSIMVITDSNTDPDFLSIMKHDLADDFPDSPYVDQYGLSLNFKFLADKLSYPEMPNDVHLSMRTPVKTLADSKEEMEESYDRSFKVFAAIVDDLTAQAQETDDPGLEDNPIHVDYSSSSAESGS